jgi:hypothetical protein
LTGTNFADVYTVSSVLFNGAAAIRFNVFSRTQVTATVPADATTGRIAVTTPGGTGTSATNFTVTPSLPPTLTLFAPTSGVVGSTVTLTGTHFYGASAVTFNGAAAASFALVADTQITAIVPVGATSGPIAVTTPGGVATSAARFTVKAPAKPKITKIKPAAGKRGATVTLSGSGFGVRGSASAVRFGATKCSKYLSWSATKIKCKVPAKAKYGKIKVTVTTAAGRSAGKTFTVKR